MRVKQSQLCPESDRGSQEYGGGGAAAGLFPGPGAVNHI